MTTVSEAKRELAQIAERQAELQKIVDAAPKSLLTHDKSGYTIGGSMRLDGIPDFAQCESYADALDTLLMLRHQPGTEAVRDGYEQWVIDINGDSLTPDDWMSADAKIRFISPCFATYSAADDAIKVVGKDRILRMFRTLHGVA